MEQIPSSRLYRVWGADKVVYGPFQLETLVEWLQSGRANANTWVLLEAINQWHKAKTLPELKAVFTSLDPATSTLGQAFASKMTPASLRRIKLFAGLDEPQLESFARYLEAIRFPQFSHIVRQGDHGDAMYLILEGEVRALAIVDGKESTLATMKAGEWFGEISLLDQGPRSVDIIADRDSVLLRLSSAAFERLLAEAPALAMPLLLALSRTSVDRLRRVTKRYVDSVRFIRSSGMMP
jgi:hypothetical protein